MSNSNHHEEILDIKVSNLNLSKKSLESILESIRVAKKRLSNAENLIMEAYRAQYSASRDIPGEIGFFDGEYLVTKENIKYEVPKSYSAKSLLIVGDELKKYSENGEDKFKIVNKIPRKKVKGTLSKKDGKYFILLENNKSYSLLKSAVEFRNLKHGDQVIAVIPEVDSNSDYAAIDKLAPQVTVATDKKEKVTNQVSEIAEKSASELKTVEQNTNTEVTSIKPKIEFTEEDLI